MSDVCARYHVCCVCGFICTYVKCVNSVHVLCAVLCLWVMCGCGVFVGYLCM